MTTFLPAQPTFRNVAATSGARAGLHDAVERVRGQRRGVLRQQVEPRLTRWIGGTSCRVARSPTSARRRRGSPIRIPTLRACRPSRCPPMRRRGPGCRPSSRTNATAPGWWPRRTRSCSRHQGAPNFRARRHRHRRHQLLQWLGRRRHRRHRRRTRIRPRWCSRPQARRRPRRPPPPPPAPPSTDPTAPAAFSTAAGIGRTGGEWADPGACRPPRPALPNLAGASDVQSGAGNHAGPALGAI